MSLWREFFEGDNGKGSSTKLLQIASFPFSTAIALWIHTVEALLTYGGLYVTGYLGGKVSDMLQNRPRSAPTVNAAGPSTVNITAKGKK